MRDASMDELVRQAMAKWPNVPDCYGWLGLDARGRWWLRDEAAQARGAFAGGAPGAKGSRLEHDQLIGFIQRNYAADRAGQWFFQNGPQRVFVELEVAPWVWRVAEDGAVRAHDGRTARVQALFVDERGRVFLRTDLGFGLVHTQDIGVVADQIEAGHWTSQGVQSAQLPQREGYVLSPQAAQARR